MPLSALFLLMMGVGGWLVYDAVKGKHPWEDFTTTVKGSQAGVPGSGVPSYSGIPTLPANASAPPAQPGQLSPHHGTQPA